MTTRNHDIESILREHGYSITRQRRLVFDLLNGHAPMTMYELYERANDQLDRASVYRIITLFEKLGIVQRINIGWKYKIELSDMFTEHHHHLTCLQCQKVIPISEEELERFISSLSVNHEFTPTGHQVEVQGYCKDCSGLAREKLQTQTQ